MRGNSFASGSNISCGCYAREILLKRTVTHGMTKSKEHQAWGQMLDRCRNQNNQSYKNYGGRGISVCERWYNFMNFYSDMGAAPIGTSIERKDNNGDYCKKNCKWATSKEQQNNTRYNKIITMNEVSKNITQWSEKLGVKRSLLYNRINRGWSSERALTIVDKFYVNREVVS